MWAFCRVCFCCPSFQHAGLLVTSPCARFSLYSTSTTGAELGFCCAWPPPGGDGAEVASTGLNPRNDTRAVGGDCNFISSVLLQQKFEVKDRPVLQPCVTAQFYLESKGKCILEVWGRWSQKAWREEKPLAQFWLLFCMFFSSPWACPMQIGLARRAVCFTRGSHSCPRTFLCSIFMGFSLLWLLATAILPLFFYLPLLGS